MAKKTYPYFSYIDQENYDTIYEPRLPVLVAVNGIRIPQTFLVDSGGYATMLNAELAQAFGINLSQCPVKIVSGISGEAEGRVHEVVITIKGFKPLTVNAIFVNNLSIGGLLGQRDFFKEFYVRFEQPENSFTIEDVPTLKWE